MAVSVAMVSEGVDIKRLRVLVYLPNAQTELFFRQAIGRVVRSFGRNDNTSAYVVMPKIPQFEKFALNIEKEMPPKKINDIQRPQKKVCPICDTDCSIMLNNVMNVVMSFLMLMIKCNLVLIVDT